MLKLKLSILLIIVVLNCFAQKVFKNSSTPKDEKFNIVLGEKAVCDFNDLDDSFVSFSLMAPTNIDKDSSLFFLDSKNSKMLKFDKNGQLITSFSNPGNGPGEFPNFFVTIFYLTNDSLYLVKHPESRIMLFDNDGNFSCNRQYSRESYPSGRKMFVKNNKFLIYKTFDGMYGDVTRKLVFADLNMRSFKVLFTQDTKETPAMIMSGKNDFEIACSENEIYMSVPGDNGRYLINVYDLKGNLKYEIKKHYRKVKTNNDKLNQTLKINSISTKGISDYERPIESMFCDPSGRLFVQSPKDDDKKRCYYFDVFEKGEFINRIGFEMPENIDGIAFRNDFAYGYDCENNSMVVYEYKEVRK